MPAAPMAPQHHLALAADVEQAGAGRDDDGERAEQERRGADQRLAEAGRVAERRVPHRLQRLDGSAPRARRNAAKIRTAAASETVHRTTPCVQGGAAVRDTVVAEPAAYPARPRRRSGRASRPRSGRDGAVVAHEGHVGIETALMRPAPSLGPRGRHLRASAVRSCWRSAPSASTMPATWPSWSTTIRSATMSSSSRSSDTISTPTPAARRSSSSFWVSRTEATSRPRLG